MRTTLVLASMSLLGCGHANLGQASAGFVGCPPEEIAISNDTGAGWSGTRSWIATCHGKRHVCSAVAGSQSTQVNCKEESAPAPPPG